MYVSPIQSLNSIRSEFTTNNNICHFDLSNSTGTLNIGLSHQKVKLSMSLILQSLKDPYFIASGQKASIKGFQSLK